MSGADGGKTWSQIEAEPDPWGQSKDYNFTFKLFGLDRRSVIDHINPDRKYGNILTDEQIANASGFVSTDVNTIFVKPTDLPAGQYYRSYGTTAIQHHADVHSCPGNVGGFHGCVIDTEQPGSKWHLLARFVYVGSVYAGGPDMGSRPHMAILAHPDLLIGTKPTKPDGSGIEMLALTKITDIQLPATTSRLLFSDTCQDWTGRLQDFMLQMIQNDEPGVMNMTCVGDGYFPVYVGRDGRGRIRKITVLFKGHFEEDVLLRVASKDEGAE